MLSRQDMLVLDQFDHAKITYRKYAHSSCSMRVIGVYPKDKNIKDVENEVQGTFGGRFIYFDKGLFEYIAYTD